MTFSWAKYNQRVIDNCIRREKQLAKGGAQINKEWAADHPNEVAAAASDNFTELTKRVKDKLTNIQKQELDRRARFGG